MPIFLAVVDLLKAWAWPIAIIIIAVVYKHDIRGLLSRLRKAGMAGVELDSVVEQQRKVQAAPSVSASGELRQLPGFIRTPPIARVEKKIIADLENVPEDDRIDTLVRVLAQSRIETLFERIYGLIFGSQISLLRRLNARPLSLDEVSSFYVEFRDQHPDLDYGPNFGFDEWLRFVVNQEMVQGAGNMLQITDLGTDFLSYLTGARLPENKAL